jgi:hypothetical protein
VMKLATRAHCSTTALNTGFITAGQPTAQRHVTYMPSA